MWLRATNSDKEFPTWRKIWYSNQNWFVHIKRLHSDKYRDISKVLKSDSLQRPISWIDHNVFTSWHQPQCQTAVLRWGFLVGTVMLNVARSKSICWMGLVLFLSSFQPACRNEWNSRSWGGYWVAEIFMSLISFYSESSVFKVLIVYESVTSRLTWRKHGQNLRTLKPGCCFPL